MYMVYLSLSTSGIQHCVCNRILYDVYIFYNALCFILNIVLCIYRVYCTMSIPGLLHFVCIWYAVLCLYLLYCIMSTVYLDAVLCRIYNIMSVSGIQYWNKWPPVSVRPSAVYQTILAEQINFSSPLP
jgi:hypothetical protein